MKYIPLLCIVLASSTLIHSQDTQEPEISKASQNLYKVTYKDPEDGKNHGRLKFELQPTSNGWELDLKIGTSGIDVDALNGWTERLGRNRHTAFELEYLLKLKDAAFVEIRDKSDKVVRRSSLGDLTKSRWPERRLKSDGTIDYMAFTKRLYLDETHMKLDGLYQGDYIADIVVRGEARLRAEIKITETEAQISSMKLLGHSKNPLSADYFMVNKAEKVEAFEPLSAADWSQLDIDGKWEVYDKISSDKRAGSVVWLAEQKDYEFIEQIAVYDPNGILFYAAANTLFVERAPQWIRVAALATLRTSGHSGPQGISYLTDPAVVSQVMAWDKRYSDKVKGSQFPMLGAYLKQEKEKGFKPGKVGNAMPPLNLDDLVIGLKIDQQGKRKFSKIKRAVDAVVTNQLWNHDGVFEMLEHQLSNGSQELQRHIAFAYTHNRNQAKIPVRKLLSIAQDEKSNQKLREAALLAYASGDRLGVIVTMLQIIPDTQHPLWETAVSIMGDLDIGVMAGLLDKSGLEPKQLELWNQELQIIESRVANFIKSNHFYLLQWKQVAFLAKKETLPQLKKWMK